MDVIYCYVAYILIIDIYCEISKELEYTVKNGRPKCKVHIRHLMLYEFLKVNNATYHKCNYLCLS